MATATAVMLELLLGSFSTTSSLTRLRLLAVLVLACGLGSLALASPAAAMFTGVVSVQRSSVFSSAGRTISVPCPAGKRVMSAGFRVTPPDGRVTVNYIRPSATLTSVSVSASEDEAGVAESWTLTAYAICAFAPAGLQLVKATSAASSAGKVAYAVCPAGKQVLGTGGEVTGAAGQLLLRGLTPSSSLDRVSASAYEDETGTTASWTLTAYAICGSPAQRVVRRNQVSAYASGSPRYISRPCEPGEAAVGMGGALNGTGNQLVLQGIHPDLGDDQGPGVVAAEDRTGHAGTWTPEAFTICAAEVSYTPLMTAVSGQPDASLSIECDPGRSAIGTGAATDRARGGLWLSDFGPQSFSDVDTTVSWLAESHQDVLLTAYALCATTPPGFEPVTAATGEPAGAPQKTAVAPCPAGKRALSGGASILEGANHTVLQTVIPSADLTSVRVDVSGTEGGQAGDWHLLGTAVCATPPPGLQRVAHTTAADSSENKTATAACPAGKHLVGMGALVRPQAGQVVLDDIAPNFDLTSVTVNAYEDRTGYVFDWSLTAYAVCATR